MLSLICLFLALLFTPKLLAGIFRPNVNLEAIVVVLWTISTFSFIYLQFLAK